MGKHCEMAFLILNFDFVSILTVFEITLNN